MNLKTKIVLILFIIIFSCKTNRPAYQNVPGKMLISLKTGLGVKKSGETYNNLYKIKFKNNVYENTESIFIGKYKSEVINIIDNLDKNYKFEVFDNKYLIISEYTNLSAAGGEQMNRIKMYIVNIVNPNKIYKYTSDGMRLVTYEKRFETFKDSPSERNTYCISNIENKSLFLKDVNGKVYKYDMEELDIGVTIE